MKGICEAVKEPAGGNAAASNWQVHSYKIKELKLIFRTSFIIFK